MPGAKLMPHLLIVNPVAVVLTNLIAFAGLTKDEVLTF
jgi:hypothetical protein